MDTNEKLSRFVVPAWVIVSTYPIGPCVQFLLIRLGLPRWIYLLIPFLLSSLDPLILYSEPFFVFAGFVLLKLFIYLRILDIGLLPPKKVRSWTFREYCEYLYTFYNRKEIEERKKLKLKVGSAQRILPQQMTFQYYLRLLLQLLALYLLYNVLIRYMIQFPPSRNQPIRGMANLFDAQELFTHFVFGSILCTLLTMNYNSFIHVITFIFNVPFEPIMNNPFVSTSFRDFWSNRWNIVVKENLHRLGFQPAMKILKALTPNKKENWKPPSWHALIAALNAFFVSGLIHEWLNLVLLDHETHWEHMIFFLIHGLITCLEVIISKVSKRWLGIDLINGVPKWISIPRTYILFIWTSPLFLNPWIREDLLIRMKLPTLF